MSTELDMNLTWYELNFKTTELYIIWTLQVPITYQKSTDLDNNWNNINWTWYKLNLISIELISTRILFPGEVPFFLWCAQHTAWKIIWISKRACHGLSRCICFWSRYSYVSYVNKKVPFALQPWQARFFTAELQILIFYFRKKLINNIVKYENMPSLLQVPAAGHE